MCTDNLSAGTSRQAELRPNLPSHFFPAVRDKKANTQGLGNLQNPSLKATAIRERDSNAKYTENTKTNMSRPHGRNSTSSNTKSQRDLDNFDGDDLQLDDFLIASDHKSKAKDTEPNAQAFDDLDWISIDSIPPNPAKQVTKAPIYREEDWAAGLGEQNDDEYEPFRLPNGKWACNHKCKDKTRFGNAFVVSNIELMIPAASISAAGKAWINPRRPRSEPSLRLPRKMASAS